jgi:DNA mismatch repair ATPase MutS
LKNKILLQQVQGRLKYISDIDSIMTRLALWRSNCRDLIHLKKSLQMINEIFELVEKSWTEILKEILLK